MKKLPDQIYIEQLRQRLWLNRGLGRASVMVGAGFSRNADPLSPGMSLFPLWRELTRAMATDLYPLSVDANANKDTLRLATEYESVFGRDALNSLIVKGVPDTDYKPGLLHRMLVSLPWSDIFTTNYDTLLERTLPDIFDRKYEIVLTPSDLPARVKPRIIKLHGSFPSHQPFIATQEDFRTYPRRFAPFVNTVQQSIIENTLCLLGFSGEDPNFLHWAGWVRDNLGELSPPIYFCSLFEVSPSERRVLEKRNVFPIDLSQVIDKNVIPDDDLRFTKILEWFLLELWNGAPLNNLNYPRLERQNRWTASHNVPPSSDGGVQGNDLGERFFVHNELSVEKLKEIKTCWSKQRQTYPGWVILPTDNRERLWAYTEGWIEPVLHSLNNLPAPENLSLLFELNWRLENCLLPLPDDRAAKIYQQLLSRFNPFPTMLLEKAEFQPDNEAGRDFKWSEISRDWTELTFALLRRGREHFDDTGFQELIEKLREIVKLNEDWQARWFYERCLFALFRLDHEAARKILLEWDKNLGDSFWRVKRAAILTEIGEIKQAEEEAEVALINIRKRQQPFTNDYTLFSQEGWTLLLLKGIKDNHLFRGDKSIAGEYQDRWERLSTYRCNPWVDLENFELKVKNLDPNSKPAKTITKGFSPGEVTTNYSLISSSEPEKMRLALSFLRMFEEAGLPFRSNRLTNFSEAVTKAAICLANSDLEQTISTIIRIEKSDEMSNWFDREHVVSLSESSVNRFFVLFSNSFTDAVQRYQKSFGSEAGDTALRRIKLFAELLSRLSFRLPLEQLETVFSYAEQVYKHPLFIQNSSLHDAVKVLFKRVLEVIPPGHILDRMNQLLTLPIPTEGGFEVAQIQTWIEPFEWVRRSQEIKLPLGFDRSVWNPAVENLLRIVRSGQREARIRASYRLEMLFQIGALTPEETKDFARAIWLRTDPQTKLPVETNFKTSAFFLSLPNPDIEETKNSLRLYLIDQDFPPAVHVQTENGQRSVGIGFGGGGDSVIDKIIQVTLQKYSKDDEAKKFIDWSPNEIMVLLKKAVASWEEHKSYWSLYGTGDNLFSHNIRRTFLQLADLFAVVLLPRLAEVNVETKETVRIVLNEMEAEKLFPLSALPAKLFIAPENREEVFSKVLKGLRSTDEKLVGDAAHGTRNWLFFASKSGLTEIPERLLDELVSIAVLRRQPGLLSVIKILAWIAEMMPEAFTERHFEDLTTILDILKPEANSLNLNSHVAHEQSQIVPKNEQTAFRDSCRRLSLGIKRFYESNNNPLPDVIHFWVN